MNMFLSEMPQPQSGKDLVELWRNRQRMLEPNEAQPPIPKAGMQLVLNWIDEREAYTLELERRLEIAPRDPSKGGRPKGSKNKPKGESDEANQEAE